MPMGVSNAPGHFQRIMDGLLNVATFPFRKNVLCYLDDDLIHSETLDEHLVHVEAALKALNSVQMKLKIENARWW